MDPNVLRECAERLIETANMMATTSTVSTAAASASVVTSSATTASSHMAASSLSRSRTTPTEPRTELNRVFGYRPPTGGNVRRGSGVGQRGARSTSTNRTRRPTQSWTRAVVCLASAGSSTTPSPAERIALSLNDLGEKKIEFPKFGNGAQVHQCILDTFPQLGQHGYSVLRTAGESGRNRDLMEVPMPATGFSVEFLRSALGQAKAYVRPLQGEIPLAVEKEQDTPYSPEKVLMLDCMNCGVPVPMNEMVPHQQSCGGGSSRARSAGIEQYCSPIDLTAVENVQELVPCASEKDIENALVAAKGDTNAAVDTLLRTHDVDTTIFPSPPQVQILDDEDDDKDLTYHSWINEDDKEDKNLHIILESLEEKVSGADVPVCVKPNQIVIKALSIYKDSRFDYRRPLRVTFEGQPAIDVGGPKREFFSKLFHELSIMNGDPLPAFFEGPKERLLPIYNTSLVYSNTFTVLGRMIAHSIAQCGVGFPYLSPCAYWYIVTEDIARAVGYVTLDDIRDLTTMTSINKIINAKDQEAINDVRKDEDVVACLSEAGCVELPTLENKQVCVESLMLAVLNRKKTVLDQLCKGLKTLDILDVIRRNPITFEPLFISNPTKDLDSESVISILTFEDEDDHSKEYLLKFIRVCGKPALKKFLQCCTAGTTLPRQITVYCVERDGFFTSTCEKELHIPQGLESYEMFVGALTAIMDDKAKSFNAL